MVVMSPSGATGSEVPVVGAGLDRLLGGGLGLALGLTLGLGLVGGLAATLAALALLDLGHVGGGVLHRGADLVDIQLDAGTVLALTVGERPLLEAALGDDAVALLEGRGDAFRGVATDHATHGQHLAVLPLVRLAVEGARGGGDGEARDRDTRLGEAKLGIGGEVADDGDDGVVCHVNLSSVSWLARLRVATWLGPEVRDRREVSLPSVQWAAGSPRGATAARGPWPLGRRALGRGRSRPARRAGESARHPGPMREPRCAPARPPSPRRPPQRSARCASGWRPGARRLALRPGARRWSRCQSPRSRWSLPLRRSSRRLARTASSSSSGRRSMR